MSFTPGEEDYSEFLASWNTANQSLPIRTSGGELYTDFTLNLNNLTKDGEATLSSNQVSTNSAPAFWTGDIRSNAGTSSFNIFTIEFDNNDLIRNAALQDQRFSFCDDMCYGITKEAILKIKINQRSGGNTIAPYVRILGVLVDQ